jgi:hypothetical protein
MVSAIIKGNKTITITEEEATRLSRTQKIIPCHICGKLFSYDEKRISIYEEGIKWIHPYCKKKQKEVTKE